jgi:2,5-diketo-D-gluconate reductase B
VGYSPLGRGRILDHPTIRAVADEAGHSPAAVCLAWTLARGVTPIPRATDDHVRENLAAAGIDLTAAALDRLDGIDDRRRVIDPAGAARNRD